MDTQTILKYVMNSPENTNPNVLKGMLDALSESSDSEIWNIVFEGNVRTLESENMPNPSGPIKATLSAADRIKVTFNGTEYECEKKESEGETYYGADRSDFSEYPFTLFKGDGVTFILTPEAGTYSLKIEELQSGGGDETTDFTILFDDTVEARNSLNDDSFAMTFIEPLVYGSKIRVTIDDNEYICERTVHEVFGAFYGAPILLDKEAENVSFDWSEFPFNINPRAGEITAITFPKGAEEKITHSLKIECPSAKGIVPNGKAYISTSRLVNITVGGIFYSNSSDGTPFLEQGKTVINANEQVTFALPTIGEGAEEHIDCDIRILKYEWADVAQSGINLSSTNATCTQLYDKNGVKLHVWRVVTANGVTTCNLSVETYVS